MVAGRRVEEQRRRHGESTWAVAEALPRFRDQHGGRTGLGWSRRFHLIYAAVLAICQQDEGAKVHGASASAVCVCACVRANSGRCLRSFENGKSALGPPRASIVGTSPFFRARQSAIVPVTLESPLKHWPPQGRTM